MKRLKICEISLQEYTALQESNITGMIAVIQKIIISSHELFCGNFLEHPESNKVYLSFIKETSLLSAYLVAKINNKTFSEPANTHKLIVLKDNITDISNNLSLVKVERFDSGLNSERYFLIC